MLRKGCAELLAPDPEHWEPEARKWERFEPAAIVTATERPPEQVGALYPFPLIGGGDFDIPSAYCTDEAGERLAEFRADVVLPLRALAAAREARRGGLSALQGGLARGGRWFSGDHMKEHTQV